MEELKKIATPVVKRDEAATPTMVVMPLDRLSELLKTEAKFNVLKTVILSEYEGVSYHSPTDQICFHLVSE